MSSDPMPAPVQALAGGHWSVPDFAFASACTYQVFACGAPEKFAKTPFACALPRTPEDALHESAVNCAAIVISTELWSFAAQRLAAYWSALKRCAPSVVPALPPTGATA